MSFTCAFNLCLVRSFKMSFFKGPSPTIIICQPFIISGLICSKNSKIPFSGINLAGIKAVFTVLGKTILFGFSNQSVRLSDIAFKSNFVSSIILGRIKGFWGENAFPNISFMYSSPLNPGTAHLSNCPKTNLLIGKVLDWFLLTV